MGLAGNKITIVYSKEIEGDDRLHGCSRRAVVLQPDPGISAQRYPSSAARLDCSKRMREKVLRILKKDELRMLTGQQVTDD